MVSAPRRWCLPIRYKAPHGLFPVVVFLCSVCRGNLEDCDGNWSLTKNERDDLCCTLTLPFLYVSSKQLVGVYLSRVDLGARPVLSLVSASPFTLRYAETFSIGIEAPSMVGAPGGYVERTRG